MQRIWTQAGPGWAGTHGSACHPAQWFFPPFSPLVEPMAGCHLSGRLQGTVKGSTYDIKKAGPIRRRILNNTNYTFKRTHFLPLTIICGIFVQQLSIETKLQTRLPVLLSAIKCYQIWQQLNSLPALFWPTFGLINTQMNTVSVMVRVEANVQK